MPELPPLPDMPEGATPASVKPAASKPTAAKAMTPAAASPAEAAPATAPATPAEDLPALTPATLPPPESPAAASPASAAEAPAPPGSSDPSPAAPASPPELGPPSADNRAPGAGPSANAIQVAALPPLEPVPSAGPSDDGGPQRTGTDEPSTTPMRRASARRDGRILRASIQKPVGDSPEQPIPSTWHQASLTAAQVGDDIITMRELLAAVSEQCKRRQTSLKDLSREDKNMLAGIVLKRLIDQNLLLQEAKHTIKNPKMYEQFNQEADRYWREDQIPQLETEYHADNEFQLRDRLKEHGRSFDAVAQMARANWMAENFLHAKIKDRLKVDLPELLKYYETHKHHKAWDRPAQIHWREIVVEAGRYPSRQDARRKIEALHQALGRGADFAALAKAQSDGPTRSREQGGLMQTSPGTYGVAAVNQALDSLPAGQISGILEGPTSFHIVRVEQRRTAGPAPFSELQDQIRSTLLERKYQAERTAYLQKLWDQTPVSTIFDDSESDPRRLTN
jgi:peptidyl-prolyl cis-trans isomerase SurA